MARRYGTLALERAPLATLYPGILEMLRVLAARGRAQAVVSNSEGAFIRSILGRLGAAPHLRVMIGEDDMPAPKPDPRGLLASLGPVPPHRAVYVGDSGTDLATARAAGLRAIGVTWGTHSRQELEPMGFDALVDTPLELAYLV
jgi:phosphoglycolate phosphatase